MSSRALRRLGLIGTPIGHSCSPAMQQAALDALGIAARYERWETAPEALPARIASLRQPDVLGANVTIPYKVSVLPLLDSITPDARRQAGAINTIVREETPGGVRLIGHNTDVLALLRVLDERRAWTGARHMLVLGAGGAAQAALGVALLRGVEPWVAARKRVAAREALALLWARQPEAERKPGELPQEWARRAVKLPIRDEEGGDQEGTAEAEVSDAFLAALSQADILVNATPIGTGSAHASPIPLELLRYLPPRAFVFDMIYQPPETALVRAARASGRRATGGLHMLLYQGAASFTLWTQREAPLTVMRAALGLSSEEGGLSP